MELPAVAREIETFLDTYLDVLPNQFGLFQTHRDFWRALILTLPDKYGYCSIRDLSMYENSQIWGSSFKRLVNKVHKENTMLRKVLSLRMDTDRIQMQRPLTGRSLLSITTSRSAQHARALRTLCVLAIHPVMGVEGFRVNNYAHVPFELPTSLQDRLPNISSTDEQDQIFPAKKLTTFVENIYLARHALKSGSSYDPKLNNFIAFVQRSNLHSDFVWQQLGNLPDTFDNTIHAFVIKVPYVIPGKQVIIWNTWHATAGSTDSTPKITAFVDLVPRRYFDQPERLAWYKYVCQYAPMDPGTGSGRGSYLSFVMRLMDYVQSGYNIPYGLNDEYMEMFDNGLRHMAVDSRDMQGTGTLSPEQIQSFHDEGYLVIDIPDQLVRILPPEKSIENFNRFIRTITGDSNFSMNDHLHRVLEPSVSFQQTGSKYTYYSNRINTADPLNPFVNGKKSMNAQKGGKLIAKNCGLGKGTTYVSEPYHIAFQYSQFVYNVMKSFYHPGETEPLIVVNERFRAKTTSSWANGTHIDTAPVKLIPDTFHAYRANNNLPMFY